MPNLGWERRLGGVVCGVDEVGRGPLAGPVIAAAVILPRRLPRALRGLDDSKVLTPAARQSYAAALRRCAQIGVGGASVAEIDTLNILHASMLAMARAVAALGVVPDMAIVDGNRTPLLPCPVQALVGGDGLSLSVAAAAVVAKVTRDLAMARLAERYRDYGWEHNAGYATEHHRDAIVRHGVTVHHRRSFAPVREALSLREGQNGGLVQAVAC